MMRSVLVICLLFNCFVSNAEVSRVEISSREVILKGKEFGEFGAYELLQGKVFFTFDPNNQYNSRITDIQLAEKNEKGLVEAWSEIVILKPVDQKLSQTALVEVSNRGGKFSLRYFNLAKNRTIDPSDESSFGDGLLMEQGLTVVWIGWQFDVPEGKGLKLRVPIAHNPDGSSIYGLVRSDWVVDEAKQTLKLGHRNLDGYPAAEPGADENILTVRSGRDEIGRLVPKTDWGFGKKDLDQISLDPNYIYHNTGFEAGNIYELVYISNNPPVVGLGLAAIRDIMSYMKYNPACEFQVKNGLAAGVSQTGRFLRHFIYQGFNTDEKGRKSYDGIFAITAGAGRGSFNHRFAQPSRDAHRYSAFFYPTDLFPFSSKKQFDEILGYEDGLAIHQWNENHLPKTFYINTGYEYWGRAAALIHTSGNGITDIEPPENERIYHIGSGQHFTNAMPENKISMSLHGYRGNPLNLFPNYRSLLVQLQQWIADDQMPPNNRYPKISEQTLVSIKDLNFKSIGKIEKPTVIHTAYRADYGGGWGNGLISFQPPRLREQFVPKVSQVNALGNEIAGIKNIEIRVPLATYTPWHVRKGQAGGNGELTDFRGTFIPLSLESNESDDRPAIAELYKNKKQYLGLVDSAIDSLVQQKFVLERDKKYLRENASNLWDWIVE